MNTVGLRAANFTSDCWQAAASGLAPPVPVRTTAPVPPCPVPLVVPAVPPLPVLAVPACPPLPVPVALTPAVQAAPPITVKTAKPDTSARARRGQARG